MRERPSFENYFLGIAKVVSLRSADIHTQHGCVIVSSERNIVATGYNSFPRGMNDATLPTSRPEKYDWMIHSEVNALANAVTSVRGATAYVTGQCCFGCLKMLHQHGIERVVQGGDYGWSFGEQERGNIGRLLKDSKMIVETVWPDYSWLVEMVENDSQINKGGKCLTS